MLSLLALLVVAAPACGDARVPGDRRDEARRFSVDLVPLNDSGVEGAARMSLAGEHLSVDVDARGLEPNRIHEQHVHGLAVPGENTTCPRPGEDAGDDGVVDLREGGSAFGRSLRALEPFPTVGRGGRLDYRLTLTVAPDELEPLENRVLVLRGRSSARGGMGAAQYVPDLPVACGEIRSLAADDL